MPPTAPQLSEGPWGSPHIIPTRSSHWVLQHVANSQNKLYSLCLTALWVLWGSLHPLDSLVSPNAKKELQDLLLPRKIPWQGWAHKLPMDKATSAPLPGWMWGMVG